jgi:hypothetical protein
MSDRVKHTYRTNLYSFASKVLVVCPNCEGMAVVYADAFNTPKSEIFGVRVICAGCGYNKTKEHLSKRHDPKQKQGDVLIFGAPVDPFFHLPVWLQTDFSAETLWAYNPEHLDFLAEHVGAKLRERNGFKYNVRSIGARLPRWMTSAANREAILKEIETLKGRV